MTTQLSRHGRWRGRALERLGTTKEQPGHFVRLDLRVGERIGELAEEMLQEVPVGERPAVRKVVRESRGAPFGCRPSWLRTCRIHPARHLGSALCLSGWSPKARPRFHPPWLPSPAAVGHHAYRPVKLPCDRSDFSTRGQPHVGLRPYKSPNTSEKRRP